MEVPLFGQLTPNGLSSRPPSAWPVLPAHHRAPPAGDERRDPPDPSSRRSRLPGTQQVRTSALCQLTNLELVLEVGGDEIVTLPLPLFEFKTVDGGKPDVNVKLGRIAFGGVLRLRRDAGLPDRR